MSMDWGHALSKLRCPICQSGFAAEDVSPIREFEQELYVRCICTNCHSVSAAVFVRTDDLITEDDVVAVHEFLIMYRGNAVNLF